MTDPGLAPPARPADAHKGEFGTVMVIGGQCGEQTMIGGPALSALAALRVGAGLAVLAMPEPVLAAGLTIAPSATGIALATDGHRQIQASAAAEAIDRRIDQDTVIAVGPGLGTALSAQQLVMRLVARPDLNLVVDADALNCLALTREFDRDLRASIILTPHPGEWRRLAGALGLRGDPIDPTQRVFAATALASRLGCIVALKGKATVVSNGIEHWVCPAGNPALATGGTGDVLTGVIAGLLAQRLRNGPHDRLHFDSARLGVLIHAMAADRWAERRGVAGMLATDLLPEIPMVLQALRRD